MRGAGGFGHTGTRVTVRVVPAGQRLVGQRDAGRVRRAALLVDAGLSARELTARLDGRRRRAGVDLRRSCSRTSTRTTRAGSSASRSKHRVPVFTTPETLAALELGAAALRGVAALRARGSRSSSAACAVDPFPIPHDAATPVGFVLEAEGVRIGIATDLGHATTLVLERLRGCHLLMRRGQPRRRDADATGPIPWAFKQRVGGRLGHLSNEDAAAPAVAASADEDCRP